MSKRRPRASLPASGVTPAAEGGVSVAASNDGGSLRARRLANLAPHQFKPGQSGNPSGKSKGVNEAVRLYRDAAPEAARRLIDLMDDPDSRVAVLAAQAVYEKATGKHFDPSAIRDEPQLRLDLKRLTTDELRFLLRIVDKGAIELQPEQGQEARERIIDGEAIASDQD